jgi:transposase InsO family protein
MGGGSDLRGHRRGFVYIAFVIDVYSRAIVGWRASSSLRSSGWAGFNNRRLLEPIGHLPPAEYEEAYYLVRKSR